jgi:hypothetical protein
VVDQCDQAEQLCRAAQQHYQRQKVRFHFSIHPRPAELWFPNRGQHDLGFNNYIFGQLPDDQIRATLAYQATHCSRVYIKENVGPGQSVKADPYDPARKQFVRTVDHYRDLIAQAGLQILKDGPFSTPELEDLPLADQHYFLCGPIEERWEICSEDYFRDVLQKYKKEHGLPGTPTYRSLLHAKKINRDSQTPRDDIRAETRALADHLLKAVNDFAEGRLEVFNLAQSEQPGPAQPYSDKMLAEAILPTRRLQALVDHMCRDHIDYVLELHEQSGGAERPFVRQSEATFAARMRRAQEPQKNQDGSSLVQDEAMD